jgi:hypothetical protein
MSDKELANTKKSGPVRDEKGRWIKGEPSPNPAGRPADGQSWSAIIREISQMTPEEIVGMVGKDNDLGRAFLQLPKKVQLKKLMIARVFTALMFEPNSSLLSVIMDRDEGAVKNGMNISSIDLSKLSVSQLKRIRDGEDVLSVLSTPD